MKELLQSARKVINLELDSDKKRLLENFLSLLVLQGANYVLPLITLPYLVRVLGPEKFGLIAFAQAFVQYFNILTDYGFNLSATREISIHRENKEKISEIFSSVMIIKFVLLILSFIIMTVIVFSFEKFKKDWLVYYLTFGVVIGQVLFPVWFFQGIERMRYITLLNVIARLIFAISIFIFVRSALDYIYVPILNSISILLSAFLSIMIVIILWDLKIKVPKIETIVQLFLFSTQFFLSRIVITFYTNSTSILFGLMGDYKEVAYYDASYKLVTAIRQPWDILNTVVFPFMSKYRRINFLKKIILVSFLFSIILTMILYIYGSKIISLVYGIKFEDAAQYFKILIFILPFISVHIFLGSSCLVAFGYSRYFNLSNIYSAFLYLIGIIFLFVIGCLKFKIILWMIVLVDALILCYRVFYVFKVGILGYLRRR